MGIFGFGKKKEGATVGVEQTRAVCSCGGKCSGGEKKASRLVVLGDCCKKSADTFENVKTAAAGFGLQEEVVQIGDAVEIAKFGVMQTPALVIDGKVMSCGRLIQVEDAKKMMEKAGMGHGL